MAEIDKPADRTTHDPMSDGQRKLAFRYLDFEESDTNLR